MNRPRRVHDLFVTSARWALILAKSVLIVLMLHLLASYFHWRLFREAGGAVSALSQIGRPAGAHRLTAAVLDRVQPSV